MPMYEYRCEHCGARFEELVRADTPDDEIECPQCQRTESKRELSTFSMGGSSSYGGSSSSSSSSSSCGSSGFS